MVSSFLLQKGLLFSALLFTACDARTSSQSVRLQSIPSKSNAFAKPAAPWNRIPRGGDLAEVTSEAIEAATEAASKVVEEAVTPSSTATLKDMIIHALTELRHEMKGTKADTLILLLVTALNTPLCQFLKTSPIIGFLALGVLLGPQGKNIISDIHTTEIMADIGIVFFLFEMGIHLSFDTLMKMRTDVFGLGLSQFLVTGLAIGLIASKIGGLSSAASIVLGGGLSLSSSAFVLQLLKDKNQLSTQFGKSSFGVLLLQDLAVVPLMVITPILAGSDQSLGEALGSASVQAIIALATIGLIGKFAINPFFDAVSKSKSQEAFVGAILSTVLGMSFLTEGLGLSNTLGAFLAGVLLSDTPFRHQVETEIAPFRGILVGLFFFTVGFEIDLNFIVSNIGLVSSIVGGIIALKAVIATFLCMAFGLKLSTAQQCGLILSQGGEFAIVAFRLARSLGVLTDETTKLLLTCVSLTMAATPFLEEFGGRVAKKLEAKEIEVTPEPKGIEATPRAGARAGRGVHARANTSSGKKMN